MRRFNPWRKSVIPLKTKRKEDLEHLLQREICTFLDNQSARIPLIYFAVPNALKFLSFLGNPERISAAYKKMVAEGFKPGAADLCVVVQHNGLKVGFFEQKKPEVKEISPLTGKLRIKSPKGQVSDNQQKFLAEAVNMGIFCAVSYTFEDFLSHWKDFLEH